MHYWAGAALPRLLSAKSLKAKIERVKRRQNLTLGWFHGEGLDQPPLIFRKF
jgi:hypothetical protein